MFSYLLTLLIIGAFAFLKPKATPIPTEAIIGIIYCIGLAMAILLAEKIPGGSNYITKTITGNILWVTWKRVINLGLLFAGMGLIHIWLGKSFNQISDEVCNGKQTFTMKLKLMNLIFYITFGVVVVKAVLIGGIFLVFTLLIAPSAAAGLFFQSWKNRLIFSWVMGVIGTVTGIMLSYSMNISNGPAVVCLLGILVFILAFIKLISPRSANSITPAIHYQSLAGKPGIAGCHLLFWYSCPEKRDHIHRYCTGTDCSIGGSSFLSIRRSPP